MPLESVGRYQIIGELGKGAMGVVYKATDPTIGRTVALKTMRLDVHGMEAEEVLKRFRNEARAAGVLNHSNIVTIYDAGEQQGMFFMAMECVEGVTLHKLLAERKVLPVPQVIDIARQVCAGLDYAHAHGVIHRDVKPANIMITADGTVKIMDFGIAKAGAGLTSTGQVLGTPNYMSPEQVKGRPLDGRSDLFSVGVILYEVVTGERPFAGQNVTTIVYKIVHESPIPPRDLDSTIPPGVSTVITRALEKSPEARYQHGADLVRDLENYEAAGPSTVMAPGASPPKLAPPPSSAAAAPVSVSVAAGAPSPEPAPSVLIGTKAPAAAPLTPEVVPSPPAATPAPVAEAKPAKAGAPLWLVGVITGVVTLAVALSALLYVRQRLTQLPAASSSPVPQQAAPITTAPATPPVSAPVKSATGGASAQPTPEPAKTSAAAKPKPSTPATAPAGAAASGELQLTSNPPGAKVRIDGRTEPGWVTPMTAPSFGAGRHTVIFTKPGYVGEAHTVEVAAGKKSTLAVQLAAAVATLSLGSDPAGAAILVDGKATGKVTPAQIRMEKGAHKIALRKPGFREASTTANLKEGETFGFSPKLNPEGASGSPLAKVKRLFGGAPQDMGVVQVKTKPKGAQVSLNREAAPKKTPFKLDVQPGSYTLTISLEGYKPVTRSITVEKGKTVELNEVLEKQ